MKVISETSRTHYVRYLRFCWTIIQNYIFIFFLTFQIYADWMPIEKLKVTHTPLFPSLTLNIHHRVIFCQDNILHNSFLTVNNYILITFFEIKELFRKISQIVLFYFTYCSHYFHKLLCIDCRMQDYTSFHSGIL
jgi:hypothetical protein